MTDPVDWKGLLTGGTEPTGPEPIPAGTLENFEGRTFIDPTTGSSGILRTRIDRGTGRRVYWFVAPNDPTGRALDLGASPTLLDPTTRELFTFAPTGNVLSAGKASESDLDRFFPTERGVGALGTTGSAPAWTSTREAAELQNQWNVAESKRQEALAAGNTAEQNRWQAEQDRLDRLWQEGQTRFAQEFQTAEREAGQEFSAEQNVLAQEAALKRERLGVLSNLVQSFVGAQSQARETLANLQPKPFQFAATSGGVAPFGVTPQQGFETQLQQFAGQAVPTVDPNASPEALQGVINQLTGVQGPQAPQGFGMAGGGTVPFGPTPQVRRVGEAGPETMVVDERGVTILPFDIGPGHPGFQAGGAVGFPFSPVPFNRESLLPSLTTSGLFPSFQGQNLPRGKLLPGGQEGRTTSSLAGFSGTVGFDRPFLENLGVRPQFLSRVGSPEVFFADPNTPGQFRLVTDTAGQGATGMIQPGAVTEVSDISQFGTLGGTAIGGNELLESLARVRETPTTATRFSAPIFEPTTGVMMPHPATVPSELNRLRLTNPTGFNLMLSAYESAGVPGNAVLNIMQQSLPFGQARGVVGLN